jgi:hypothetical protein
MDMQNQNSIELTRRIKIHILQREIQNLGINLIDKIQQLRLQTKVSILITDSKICIAEDLKAYSDKSLPLATYSNSESTVLRYTSIFETLWTQTELKT